MRVIAEVGSNIKSYEDCVYSIKKAREAGANFVKFQCISEFDLYGEGSKEYRPFRIEWLAPLHQVAIENEIEFMCTGFSVDTYKAIDPFVNVHKIASAEITAIDLLWTVASFRKPVLLSTGGASIDQIKFAIKVLKECPITLLYCVPMYPAKVILLLMIDRLKYVFGENLSYGYSDHSIDVLNIPTLAKAYGCSIIEKHVNFLEYSDTPDSQHALNFTELLFMVRDIKGENISVTEIDSYINKDMIKKWQRRLINGRYLRPKPE